MDWLTTAVSIGAGMLTGAALRSSIPDIPPWAPEGKRRWFSVLGYAFRREVPWFFRIMPVTGLVCTVSITLSSSPGYILFYVALWIWILNGQLSSVSWRSYIAGFEHATMQQAGPGLARAFAEAINDRGGPIVTINVNELLRVADQYGVPPQEVESLVWRGDPDQR